MRFLEWLARSPLATALKVGLSVLLAMAIADWTSTGTISFDKWQTWLIAAISAAVPVVINYLNPQDNRYGTVTPRDSSPDGDYR
jgi:hypothetical protein